MAVTVSLPLAAAAVAVLFAAGVALEHRFGLLNRLTVIWNGFINADARTSLTAAYRTGQNFEHISDEFKSILRERYTTVDVETDGAKNFKATVDDRFTVTLAATDDGVTVETNTIVTTMRGLKRDLDTFFGALRALEERTRAQATKSQDVFASEQFTATVQLPHRSKYVTFHFPYGTELQRYAFALRHMEFDWEVEQDGGTTTVQAGTRTEIQKLVRQLLGPFITLYPPE